MLELTGMEGCGSLVQLVYISIPLCMHDQHDCLELGLLNFTSVFAAVTTKQNCRSMTRKLCQAHISPALLVLPAAQRQSWL
jgi:hypothetical protein